jgi:2-polyprenyl-6-methoxyphenol hydroxylase-like FAD-dependent oxidoreductase
VHGLIAGIGGLAAALSVRRAGIECAVFEQVREPRELGVGIRTHKLICANGFGKAVWRELRGTDARFGSPPFCLTSSR